MAYEPIRKLAGLVTWRRALFCAALAMAGGLALSDSPATARRKAILRALADGSIGGLTPEERAEASKLIEWLARSSGINDPVRLNQEPVANCLNVYTTIGTGSGFCTPGNAVYESAPAGLPDAVFIDLGILKPLGVGGSGDDPAPNWNIFTLPRLRPYFFFVVTHELGHRRLHRRSGGLFDYVRAADKLSREQEEEADRFALDTLRLAYRQDMASGQSHIGPAPSDALGQAVPVPPLSAIDRFRIDLVEMLGGATLGNMFSASAYSPYFTDESHPTFIDRARGIIRRIVTEPNLDVKLRVNILFVDEFLERTLATSRLSSATIDLPDGIENLNFDDSGLLIMTTGKALYHLPRASIELRPSGATNRPLKLSEGQRFSGDGPSPWEPGLTRRGNVWSCQGFGTIGLGEGGAVVSHRGYWKAVDVSAYERLKGQSLSVTSNGVDLGSEPRRVFEEIRVPNQPARTAVVFAHGDAGSLLHCIADGSSIFSKPVAVLRQDIDRRLGLSGCEFELNTVTDTVAYLTVYDVLGRRSRSLAGFAVLGLPRLNVIEVVRSRITGQLKSLDDWDGLAVVPGGRATRCVLIKNETSPGNIDRWAAWELSASRAPALLVAQPHLVEATRKTRVVSSLLRRPVRESEQVLDLDEPWVMPSGILKEIKVIDHNRLLIQYLDDSVYLLDIEARTSTILFQAARGLSGVWTHIGRGGWVAVYSKGASRCFILRP